MKEHQMPAVTGGHLRFKSKAFPDQSLRGNAEAFFLTGIEVFIATDQFALTFAFECTMRPSLDEWNFAAIRKSYPTRADLLEAAPEYFHIVEELASLLSRGLETQTARFGTDFCGQKQRAIVQFRVPPELYDAFFNARTGYRAQYWLDPAEGIIANRNLTSTLAALLFLLPDHFAAREIQVTQTGFSREDVDVGQRQVSRLFFEASLSSELSKVWICERQIRTELGPLDNLINKTLPTATRLGVPRWGTTSYALDPSPNTAWIDFKGAFVNGKHYQPKSPEIRAREIHQRGWS